MDGYVTNLEHALVGSGAMAAATISNAVQAGKDILAPPATVPFVLVQTKSQAANVTFDGTDPAVGGAGFVLAANERLMRARERWLQARFIRNGGSDASLVAQAMTMAG